MRPARRTTWTEAVSWPVPPPFPSCSISTRSAGGWTPTCGTSCPPTRSTSGPRSPGTLPPGTLLEQLAPDLSDLAALAGLYPQQRDLTRLAARLCGLTGALHTDLGDDRAARDWLHTATRYAAMSGDRATQHWIAMAQAMTATYAPAPARVLSIAGKAAAELGPGSSAAAAQLTG